MSRPRLLLADDHVILAEGLKRLLAEDFHLVGFVEDGRELLAAAKRLVPDVVVADISMPHMNGLEAIARLKRDRPELAVVVLTMHQNPAYARRALDAGAAGYVVKHAASAELVMAIRAALRGHTFISPSIASEVIEAREEGRTALTPRQREILQLLAEGRSAKQIAESLAISPRTVEFHKYQLMEANGLRNSAELVHFAIRHGIATI
jgi:DNA-binding NarL/FixJ family response regulator